MKKTIGIFAHVDAGKTTLSEQMLYHAGALRTRGRVDHGDTLLDSDELERTRGITIYTGQASFLHGGDAYTLIDTPGHVDFSAEMERVLAVLDAAVLVISAPDGVQGHTETIWKRLEALSVPVFLFLNKTDLPGSGGALAQVRQILSEDCLDFSKGLETAAEQLAERDETLLDAYLSEGFTWGRFAPAVRRMVRAGQVFPVYQGAALRDEGVETLLQGLDDWLVTEYDNTAPFGAQVYGIRRDDRAGRLALVKVTGGVLVPRMMLGTDKAGELRRFHGGKTENIGQAEAGDLCAVAGLTTARIGDAFGAAKPLPRPRCEPLLLSRVQADAPPRETLRALRALEEEDPALAVEWDETLGQMTVRVMGAVQLETLAATMQARFGLHAVFGTPRVLYRETIARPAIGCGHFEPLRHYAEVCLRLDPAPRGSGISFASACPTDVLAANWQHLIGTHVLERTHRGVLTGAPLTDVKVTLLRGRAHLKHTEGGDFREATYRAIRQGLMQVESVLLEPRFWVTAAVETALAGRIYADFQRMHGELETPLERGASAVLHAYIPAAQFLDYPRKFSADTHGHGSLSAEMGDWVSCHDPETVTARMQYNPERDLAHTPDSVFCSHGAGFTVKWKDVPGQMHDLPRGIAGGLATSGG